MPTQEITDADGRFALPGVLAEPAFLFVARNGYRFASKRINGSDAAIEVTLCRVDEPLPEPMPTLPAPLARADELVLLHRLFDGYAERMIKEGESRELYEVLCILAVLDPARVNELLSDNRLDAWQPNALRILIATQRLRENFEDARALIEAIKDPDTRSRAYSAASAAVSETNRTRKLELLQESLVAARVVAEPGARVLQFAQVGGQLLDLGKIEEATNVLREGQGTAKKLVAIPTSPWVLGRYAQQLARIDPAAALKLIEGTEADQWRDDYLGRTAQGLAGKNPAEAQALLGMMRDVWPSPRDQYTETRLLADGNRRPETRHDARGGHERTQAQGTRPGKDGRGSGKEQGRPCRLRAASACGL